MLTALNYGTPKFGASNYRVINMQQSPRREIYGEMVNNCANPVYSTTASTDISKLLAAAKKRKISPSQAILFMLAKTANGIPEFKQRTVDNEDRQYDDVALSVAVTRGSERNAFQSSPVFNVCKIEYKDDPVKFLTEAEEKISETKRRNSLFPPVNYEEKDCPDYVHVSFLPWVHFTSHNTILLQKNTTEPFITIGKFEKNGDKVDLPIALKVNNIFVDGFHVGRFFNEFQENCNNAENLFRKIPVKAC